LGSKALGVPNDCILKFLFDIYLLVNKIFYLLFIGVEYGFSTFVFGSALKEIGVGKI
jgi:hypothetical protein